MRHLEDLTTAVRAEHHVACPAVRATDLTHPDPTGLLRDAGATVHELPMSRHLDGSTLMAVPRLRRLVSDLEPDVVHAHASVAGLVTRLAVGGRAPVMWTPHALSNRIWVRRVERWVRPRPDVVIALSESEASALRETRVAGDARLEQVPNGVAENARAASAPSRVELGIPEDVPLVGFIGRMQEQKAPLDFIAVARRVLGHRPDVHVLCVGSGALQEAVLDRAATDLPSSQFHHAVRDVDAQSLLSLLDVLVVPSLYEGGPYLPLEAMLAGVPVVATKAMGLCDYVLDGISGLTSDVGDVDGLAQQVELLLGDPEARLNLVRSAHDHVRHAHSLKDMSARYERLYLDAREHFLVRQG